MTTFFWYIIKAVIVSGIFYGYYYLALKEKTFHTWNRFYLLSAVLLSILLPLLSIPLDSASLQGSASRVIRSVTFQEEIVINAGGISRTTEWSNFIKAAYWMISACLLAWFLLKVLRIFHIRKKYPLSGFQNFHFVTTDLEETPFSFLRTIYWNRDIDPKSAEGQKILAHEITHITDKHSLDVIGLNILTALFWINPFFWLIKKELATIHEFIADRSALHGSDTKSFVKMILSSVYGDISTSITHNFFNTSIKRRLNMIKKNNQKSGYWSKIIVIPVALIVFLGVSCNINQDKENTQTERMSPPKIVKDEPMTGSGEVAQIHPKESATASDSGEMIYEKVEKEATFPGGTKAWQEYIVQKIKATLDSFTEKDYGTAVIKFVVDKDGNVTNVSSQTMKGTLLARVSEDAIRKGPKWIPATVDGHSVSAYRLQPVTLKNPEAGK